MSLSSPTHAQNSREQHALQIKKFFQECRLFRGLSPTAAGVESVKLLQSGKRPNGRAGPLELFSGNLGWDWTGKEGRDPEGFFGLLSLLYVHRLLELVCCSIFMFFSRAFISPVFQQTYNTECVKIINLKGLRFLGLPGSLSAPVQTEDEFCALSLASVTHLMDSFGDFYTLCRSFSTGASPSFDDPQVIITCTT